MLGRHCLKVLFSGSIACVQNRETEERLRGCIALYKCRVSGLDRDLETQKSEVKSVSACSMFTCDHGCR
jgi:hypothetical protein